MKKLMVWLNESSKIERSRGELLCFEFMLIAWVWSISKIIEYLPATNSGSIFDDIILYGVIYLNSEVFVPILIGFGFWVGGYLFEKRRRKGIVQSESLQ